MDYTVFHNPWIQVLLIVMGTVIVQMILRRVIEKLVRHLVLPYRFENKTDERKREDTIIAILRATASSILYIAAFISILTVLGVNLGALLTSAGVLGVVIGFGAQQSIKDVLAGIFILTENQYRVGDIITLSGGLTGVGVTGVVEDFTLRVTKLRALDGTLNIFRNGDATIITNRTFKFSNVVIDINVTYDADVDKVEKVINEVGVAMYDDEKYHKMMSRPLTFYRIENFQANGIQVRVTGKVQPAAQWDVAGEFRRRVLKAFKKADIQMVAPASS